MTSERLAWISKAIERRLLNEEEGLFLRSFETPDSITQAEFKKMWLINSGLEKEGIGRDERLEEIFRFCWMRGSRPKPPLPVSKEDMEDMATTEPVDMDGFFLPEMEALNG